MCFILTLRKRLNHLFLCYIDECTRKDAVLDLIFTSEPGMTDNLEMGELFGEGHLHGGDHNNSDKIVRYYKNINVEGMRTYFNDNEILHLLNYAWEILKNTL